jgi:hypothetical protein
MSQHTRRRESHEAPHSTRAATPDTHVVKGNGGEPSSDHIRIRAYEIFQARNGGPGNALADWIRAEKEAATRRDAEV